jgi:(2R)-3-sulfolactate dehydrogenase (NADP+)
MNGTVKIGIEEALALCENAAKAAGANAEVANSLARSAIAAEAEGHASVGLAHFVDYLEALEAGRIEGSAVPEITRPAGAIILSDAKCGAAHTGFDRAFDDLVDTARKFGVAIFSQKNAYTCGALGYFAGRLAERGLVSIAATNGPALVAGAGGTKPVYCTNPLAFAAPAAGAPPLLIDQSSSATAFINIRKAAAAGKSIPEGWALDAAGNPTTDASAAVKGTLLAFGGSRGANIALMVEVLSAGLSGANWSLDAPPFATGSKGPGTGMFVLAIAPKLLDPDFDARLQSQIARLSGQCGVHVPGMGKIAARRKSRQQGLAIPQPVYDEIARRSGRGSF